MKKQSNKMWGGRFTSGPDAIMEAINASIDFDRKLYVQDIQGSVAHAAMLAEQGIISKEDYHEIEKGLKIVLQEITDGQFVFSRQLEDIHMNIESRLTELIGPTAGCLHTARSRNDQVAVDFRLWVKRQAEKTAEEIETLIICLLNRAEEHTATLMPGFTHLQIAQPLTFGHHLMAYVEMFGRDLSRVRNAIERMDESPLGAVALAGTGFPIDRFTTAKMLGLLPLSQYISRVLQKKLFFGLHHNLILSPFQMPFPVAHPSCHRRKILMQQNLSVLKQVVSMARL